MPQMYARAIASLVLAAATGACASTGAVPHPFPMPGGRRIAKLFRGMQRPSMGFDVKFHRNVADGHTVLNERTDVLIVGRVRVVVAACGVFEVHEGRITLWRDYVDMFDMTKALVRGLAGAVVPALARKF